MELNMIPQKVVELRKKINELKQGLPQTKYRIECLKEDIKKELKRWRHLIKYYERVKNG
tara:strand:- start:483 stop:659 length:177 start_codon:yes stop_codon:yes gene_type:complete